MHACIIKKFKQWVGSAMDFNMLLLFDHTFILMHRNILHFKQACTGNIQLLHYFYLAVLQELQITWLGTYVLWQYLTLKNLQIGIKMVIYTYTSLASHIHTLPKCWFLKGIRAIFSHSCLEQMWKRFIQCTMLPKTLTWMLVALEYLILE